MKSETTNIVINKQNEFGFFCSKNEAIDIFFERKVKTQTSRFYVKMDSKNHICRIFFVLPDAALDILLNE